MKWHFLANNDCSPCTEHDPSFRAHVSEVKHLMNKFSLFLSLFLFVSLSLFLSARFSLCLSIFLSVSLCVSLFLFVALCFPQFLFVSLCLFDRNPHFFRPACCSTSRPVACTLAAPERLQPRERREQTCFMREPVCKCHPLAVTANVAHVRGVRRMRT